MKRILYLLVFFFCAFLVFDVSTQGEYAASELGESISAFLERNKRPGRTYYNEFIRPNEKRLHGKEELRLGVKYVLPSLGKGTSTTASSKPAANRKGTVRECLLGGRLADVEVTSNHLRGAYFYVISGHGGPNPGTIDEIGKVELYEDEYAYGVALRLVRNLMQEGVEVRIIIQNAKDGIRDNRYLSNSKRGICIGDAIPLNQVARLQQRCTKINELYRKDRKICKYCRVMFLYADSRSKDAQTDVFFYHAPRGTLGKRLAIAMKGTFEPKYDKHQPSRGFKGTVNSRSLCILLKVAPASVFMELGNIQNAFGQRRFVIGSNRQALAKWMMEGFTADRRRMK